MESDEIPDDPEARRTERLIDMFADKLIKLSQKYIDRIGVANIAYGYTSYVMLMLLRDGVPPDEALRYMKDMALDSLGSHVAAMKKKSETPAGEKSDSVN
jgi:hypothetical protein